MILVIYRPLFGTMGDYQQLSDARNAAGVAPAPGLKMHSAYDLGLGKLGMTEVWDSRESWEASMLDLLPTLRQLGLDVGTPEIYIIYAYFTVPDEEPTSD